MVKEAIEDAKKHLAKESIGLVAQLPEMPIVIKADRQKIMQVLTNLLNNAIRFTRPRGTIIVSTETDQNNIKVIVKDSGTGISDDVMPKLFTKFSSSMSSASGTGLGLYISKAIVEAHDGKIWADNNLNEKGATFGFAIPIKPYTDNAQVIESRIPQGKANSEIFALAKEAFGKPQQD
jgi:signal transduction histidine kinase